MQQILIVEDDKTIAESIIFILEQDSFSCKWFDNGKDSIEYLDNNNVDLMLLDIGLAGVVCTATHRATELPDGFPATSLDSALVLTGLQLCQSLECAFPRLVMSVILPEDLM